MNKGYLLYILFFFLLLTFIAISGFNGLYGQDSYEYLRYSKALSVFVKTGTNPGDYFWPLLYPIAGAFFSFVFSAPFALQLVSLLSLIFSAIYLEKLLILLFNSGKNPARIFAFLFFLLSPYMLRASLVIMSDSLSVFFVIATWYYFAKYRKEISGKYFVAFVLFFASAIATRYASIVVLIIPAILVMILFLKNFKLSGFFLAIIISILLFLPHFLIKGQNSIDFLHHEWITAWSPANFFRTHFNTADGSSSYSSYNILYCFYNLFHPAFCFAGIFFFIFLWRRGKQIKEKGRTPIILSVLLYALFLAGIPYQNLRFLLLSLPLVLMVMFPGYLKILEYLTSKMLLTYTVTGTIIIQLALFCRVFIPFYNDNQIEKEVATEMLMYQNATVYTFSIDGALKSYGFKGHIVNLSTVRMDTLKGIGSNSLVLFNLKKFSQQWQGKNPMINWEYLNSKSALVPLKNLPAGWVLYKM